MRKILILLGMIIFLSSCKWGRISEVNRDYISELNHYPKFLVSHFPSEIKTLPIVNYVINDTTNDCILYMLIEKMDDETCHIQDSLNKVALTKYIANDFNIVTIKSEGLLKWHPEKVVYYESLNRGVGVYYPIPYFETMEHYSLTKDIFSGNTKSGLTDGMIIYIIDSKPGKYWKGLKPNKYMPVGWKNGYSKGICLSAQKGILIYWFIVW